MDPNFRCSVCNIDLNGPKPAQQHYASEKHKKKAAAAQFATASIPSVPVVSSAMAPSFSRNPIPTQPYEFNPAIGRGKCFVCNIDLTSAANRDQHISGAKHSKKEREWEEQCRFAAQGSGYAYRNQGSMENNARVPSSFSNSVCVTPPPPQTFIPCEFCGKQVNTYEQLQKHQASPQCKKKQAMRGAAAESSMQNLQPNLFIQCDVCGKSVNTPEILQRHQASPKCLKARGRGSAVTNSADRTIWHRCRVCNKQLNSIEQLETHMKSHPQASAGSCTANSFFSQPANVQDEPPKQQNLAEFWNRAPIGSNRPNPNIKAQAPGYSIALGSEPYVSFAGPPSSSVSMPMEDPLRNSAPGPPGPPGPDNFIPRVSNELGQAGRSLALGHQQQDPMSVSSAMNHSLNGQQQPQPLSHQPMIPLLQDHASMNTIGFELDLKEDDGRQVQNPHVPATNHHVSAISTHLIRNAPMARPGSNPALDAITDSVAKMGVSEELQQRIEEGCKTDKCEINNCEWHCIICDTCTRGGFNKTQHLGGSKHKKKLETYLEQEPKDESNPYKHFQYYCKICQVPFNSKSSELSHNQGSKHLTALAKSQKAPQRVIKPLLKQLSIEDCEEQGYELTEAIPRHYQLDLYEQAMQDDTVIYLPTGTGKTQVACLMVSQMLLLNPFHQVVFLVDKVLLVVQQAHVLRRELGKKRYTRFCGADGSTEERELRIAALCGEVQDTGGIPMWQMDVLVVTAAYYNNLLDSSLLRWSDNSLVVMDETHHCFKEHPFHVLVRSFHRLLPPDQRPKFLGLTASPAGLDAAANTEQSLMQLLRNIGGVKLITVENEEAQSELAKYTSNTELSIEVVSLSSTERELYGMLLAYMKLCYSWMEDNTNITDLCVVNAAWEMDLEEEDFEAQDTEAGDVVTTLLQVLKSNELQPVRRSISAQVEDMRCHLEAMGYGFLEMNEIGVECLINQLEPLKNPDNHGNFDNMQKILSKKAATELSKIRQFIATNLSNLDLKKRLAEKNSNDPTLMPTIQKLIQEIETQIDWWREEAKPIVLVLVQQRETAKLLAEILQKSPGILEKQLRVTHLIGHGKTTAMSQLGMSVRTQEKVLNDIKGRKYQIVVATSIAEEGVDLPECELVLQLDPPSSVKALVQIRGRARKRGSRFVALCRTEGQRTALRNLMAHEKYMVDAVRNIVRRQREQQTP